MSAFKLNTLKQKLWAIVATFIAARITMFFALPSTPSLFAPDEETYAYYANQVSKASISEVGLKLFDTGLIGRALATPAALLIKAGISDLESIRIISGLYSLVSLIFILITILKVIEKSKIDLHNKHQKLLILTFFAYAFWPSRFIWSSLGLRESAMELGVALVLISTFWLLRNSANIRTLYLFGIFLGFTLIFLTRPQVAWLLFVSQVISALFIKGNRSRIVFICALLIAACGGYFLTTSVITETRSTFGAKPAIGSKGSDSASAAKLCEYIGEQVLIGSNKYDCFLEKTEIEKIRTSTPVETLTNNVEVLPQIQEVRAIGAESAIQQISCPFSSDSITSKYICVAWNAPYMSLTFLFRPLLFVDTTSTSSTYAALENMFWMSIFLIFCYGIVRRREKYLIVQLYPLYLFMVLYVVGAGSYQGNMGTAFRHKSLLVSGFLLLFYLAYQKTIQDRDVLSTHSPKPSPEIS